MLTPTRFDAMLDFCDDVGCKLVFGISAMYGSCCVRYDDQRVMYGTGHCEGVRARRAAQSTRVRKARAREPAVPACCRSLPPRVDAAAAFSNGSFLSRGLAVVRTGTLAVPGLRAS